LNIQNGLVVPVIGTRQQPCAPMEVLAFLLDRGCHRLTLVDVDAARGAGHNRDLIARIMNRYHRSSGKVCIQVGGGIRSSDQAQFYLDQGAAWLLVGTILHRSPLVVEQLLARFRDSLSAGVDARGGEIQASGWGEPARLKPDSAGERIKGHGFKRIFFMDIPTCPEAEPDFHTARIIATSSHIPLFMGGSIRSRAQLKAALETPGLQGIAMDALLLREDPELFGSMSPTHL
jgi:phosphoribosylformimino-5-aminoimidazole carboxamide ribotide isomerase